MADLPGLLKDLSQANYRPNSHPVTGIPYFSVDPSLGIDCNLEKAVPDTCPPLDFSPHSFESLEFLNDLPPVDIQYNLDECDYGFSAATSALLQRVYSLKDSLCNLGNQLNTKLANGATATELPSVEENSPVSTTYHFTSWRDLTGYSCFWSLLILTNKLMMRLLPPFDPTIYQLQSECRSIAAEICKTWEDAWASKPIGALHTGLSFVVAYEFCEPDVQEWIIEGMNSLLDYQMVDAFRWSNDVVAMMSGKLAGEGPGLSFSHANIKGKTM
jgi:hypothetical protein